MSRREARVLRAVDTCASSETRSRASRASARAGGIWPIRGEPPRQITRCICLLGAISTAAVLAFGLGHARAASGNDVSSPQPLAACAYGTDVPGLTGLLASAVSRAAGGYAASVAAAGAATEAQAGQVFAAAAAAYVYGLPLVTERATITHVLPNEIVSVAALPTPQVQAVVAPDVATAPSTARLDLRLGPIVIDVPDTDGLFYAFEFLDAYTNAFAYVGSGSTGTQAGAFVLVPPGWTGSLPAGVTPIDAPTDTVWLIGRTLVQSAADIATVASLQHQYEATPLADWLRGARRAPVVLNQYSPSPPVSIPTGTDFITTLNDDLAIDPPPPADDCALQAMSAAGVQLPPPAAPGSPPFAPSLTDPAVAAGTAFGAEVLAKGEKALNAYSRAANNGWDILGPWVGDYGTNYLARAIVAADGLGANTPQHAIYPVADTDFDGQQLTGSQSYTIRFPKGGLPPAGAFWSLTMYGPSFFLSANPLNRYAIGSDTPGLHFGNDGSLTIYIQSQEPTNPVEQPNWLPAPAGPFQLMLRLYQPAAVVLDGRWKPPPIKPVAIAAPQSQLSRIRISPNSFRPAGQGGIISANGPALLTYSDTLAAVVTVELIRLQAHGHQVIVARFTHQDHVGTNRLRLSGRANGRALPKGDYLIRAVAHVGTAASDTITVRYRIT